MDSRRFDALAKSIVSSRSSRRATLGSVFGAALGSIPFLLGSPAATACAKVGKPCGGDKCCSGAHCKGGKCKCKRNYRRCENNSCVKLDGGCCDGDECGVDQTCLKGICVCLDGELTACPSGCIDLFNDNENCGACTFICPGGSTCSSGACDPPSGTCEEHLVCGQKNPICEECFDPRESEECDDLWEPPCDPFRFCYCVKTREDALACGDDDCTGFACSTSAECEAEFGTGAVCQEAGTGCCGQECIVPCECPPPPPAGRLGAGERRRRRTGRTNSGR
jgi:hypothetical protein